MAISIGNTYSDYYSALSNDTAASLENTLNSTSVDSTDEELMDACKEFEAYFVEQMYKAMEKTIMKDEEDTNEYETYFSDMLVQEYGKAATTGEGIGIAKTLYEQMKRNLGETIPTALADTSETAENADAQQEAAVALSGAVKAEE